MLRAGHCRCSLVHLARPPSSSPLRDPRAGGDDRRGGVGRGSQGGGQHRPGPHPPRHRGGRAKATLAELKDVAATLEKVVAQTRQRLSGVMPEGAERVVSFHDKDARPIRKGRIGVPVEFGYKAQVVDNSDGVVLDYEVMKGNPSDGPLLSPAIRRITALFGRVPKAVPADRGYGSPQVDAEMGEIGVYKVAIPRKGKPSAARKKAESAPAFRKLVKWRTGFEGRVAALKRGYGWGRSLMDGTAGTATWCGWGIFASNGTKISQLAAAAGSADTPPKRRRRPRPASARTGPPGTSPPSTSSTAAGTPVPSLLTRSPRQGPAKVGRKWVEGQG